jgi:hypothetical protein
LLVRLKPRVLEVLTRSADETLPRDALHELSVDECVQSVLAQLPRMHPPSQPG